MPLSIAEEFASTNKFLIILQGRLSPLHLDDKICLEIGKQVVQKADIDWRYKEGIKITLYAFSEEELCKLLESVR